MRVRPAIVCALLGSLPVLVGFVWPGTVEYFATRGNRAWRAGNFEAAEKAFARALLAAPGDATLMYNRGTARYRLQRFDEATEDFRRGAEGGGEELGRDASYDLGNALFRAGDFDGAIGAYQEALRRDPGDMDAKHNLELAQRMKEQQQRQQNQQQQDQQQEQDQQEQQSQEQQHQDQQQQTQQDQQSEQQQAQQGDEQQQAAQEQRGEGELSAAEALRLLRALAAEDATVQKIIRQAPHRRETAPGEKDW